jgi:glutamine cyclotransferase
MGVSAKEATYEVLETKPHTLSLFTQGLIVDGEDLIESSGRYGQSRIVRYNASTGEQIRSTDLPSFIFAEGLAQYSGSLYLLTWREGRAYQLDPKTFDITTQFSIKTEGWGLTHNGKHFIQSDGSSTLYFRNSNTFKVEKRLLVYEGSRRRGNLNELEYAHNLIWANVYMSATILAISPIDGKVAFSLDLSELTQKHRSRDSNHVLNGIAYDPKRDAFWVTGKCWDKRYLIKVNIPQ